MDLLGDIGAEDQLSAALAENSVLHAKVKELVEQVKALTQRVNGLVLENECLKVEVETYRREFVVSSPSALLANLNLSGGDNDDDAVESKMEVVEEEEHNDGWFLRSGNGEYPKQNNVTLTGLHGAANPTCCALSPDDIVLATGGADSHLNLCLWESANSSNNDNDEHSNENNYTARVDCGAPVISTAFSPVLKNMVAVGCMDGSAQLVQYLTTTTTTSSNTGGCSGLKVTNALAELVQQQEDGSNSTVVLDKHKKYVRAVAFSPTAPLFATAAADGSIYIYKIHQERSDVGLSLQTSGLEKFSLHLPGAVESMCFTEDYLLCYARGTPYLAYFDLHQNFELQKINLNTNNNSSDATAGSGFSEHVSFAIMDLKPFQNKYVAAATDTSRNMVLDLKSGQQVRNLYGHQNDGFSQPKVAWSRNGQYMFGNSQNERCLCVWDIASSQIVERLQGHESPIRDVFSSLHSDTIVTTAYDKRTKFWFSV